MDRVLSTSNFEHMVLLAVQNLGIILTWPFPCDLVHLGALRFQQLNEPVHEISNNVVCATSKASDQPALLSY